MCRSVYKFVKYHQSQLGPQSMKIWSLHCIYMDYLVKFSWRFANYISTKCIISVQPFFVAPCTFVLVILNQIELQIFSKCARGLQYIQRGTVCCADHFKEKPVFHRKMFPLLKFQVPGLDEKLHYFILLDFTLVDNNQWIGTHKAPPVSNLSTYHIYPVSPSIGEQWIWKKTSYSRKWNSIDKVEQRGSVRLRGKIASSSSLLDWLHLVLISIVLASMHKHGSTATPSPSHRQPSWRLPDTGTKQSPSFRSTEIPFARAAFKTYGYLERQHTMLTITRPPAMTCIDPLSKIHQPSSSPD